MKFEDWRICWYILYSSRDKNPCVRSRDDAILISYAFSAYTFQIENEFVSRDQLFNILITGWRRSIDRKMSQNRSCLVYDTHCKFFPGSSHQHHTHNSNRDWLSKGWTAFSWHCWTPSCVSNLRGEGMCMATIHVEYMIFNDSSSAVQTLSIWCLNDTKFLKRIP